MPAAASPHPPFVHDDRDRRSVGHMAELRCSRDDSMHAFRPVRGHELILQGWLLGLQPGTHVTPVVIRVRTGCHGHCRGGIRTPVKPDMSCV